MAFWLSPRTWLNATLGWVARLVSDTTLESWLARVLNLEAVDLRDEQETNHSMDSQSPNHEPYELNFLNTLSDQSYPLELIPNDQLQDSETSSLTTFSLGEDERQFR